MEGQTVSHYRILKKIGEGGQGQVYLAEDTSLERKVALKFLPLGLQADPVAHKRFLREAKSAAAIEHPFICNIKEVAQTDDGQDFIVMEYVEGQTLNDRLDQGKIPIREALQIGSEVAEALEEAHNKGVIHRDLKPSNIMVTPSGHPRVMDFGLAKRLKRDKEDLTSVLTREGTTLGTLAYMSPEQLRGSTVDTRADVFSLGVVLYEMLTGVHPFSTGTQAETVNAILSEHPSPVSRYVQGVPDRLQLTLEKMLAKQPGERYQTVHEIRTNLTKVMEEITSPKPLAEFEKKRGIWIGAVAVLLGLVVVLAAVVFWPSLDEIAEGPSEPTQIRPLTADGAFKRGPQFSPDGNQLVYAAKVGTNPSDLFVRSIEPGTKPHRLTNSPEIELTPVWSPDGTEYAFLRRGEEGSALYTMPAPFGGEPRKLVDIEGAGGLLSWLPNGRWLAVSEEFGEGETQQIVLISPENGERKPLTAPYEETLGDRHPSFSPLGDMVAFARSASAKFGAWDLWVQPINDSEGRQLTFERFVVLGRATWSPDGQEIVFSAGRVLDDTRLFRVPLTGGKPKPVIGVGTGTTDPCIWGDRLAFVQSRNEAPDIWRIPALPAGAEVKPQLVVRTNPVFADDMISVSPDSRRIAFMSTRTGASEIWVAKADGTNPVQLTKLNCISNFPDWSPDGQKIVFSSDAAGDHDLYIVDVEGGEPRRLALDPSSDEEPIWSKNGQWIYFKLTHTGNSQIWKISPTGGEAIQITKGEGRFPRESTDGKYLHYWKREGTIWRIPAEGGEEVKVLDGVEFRRQWDVLKDLLYYALVDDQGYSINILNLVTRENTVAFRYDGTHSVNCVTPSPNGKWIYYASQDRRQTSDIMLVEYFQ